MLDLLDEFRALIQALNTANLPYALCGGMAMAVHGIPRATVDVDLLAPEEAMGDVKAVAKQLGFQLETTLSQLAAGRLTITRLTKFDSQSEDYLVLDLLHVTPPLTRLWGERQTVESEFGPLWVISRDGLIEMKTLRGSKQDQADIERLKELNDES